jgi:hypothetical protein
LYGEELKINMEILKKRVICKNYSSNNQIRIIQDSRNAKEEDFERMQQEEREKVKQSSTSPILYK